MNGSDSELLDAYLRDGSENAFTELLRRYVDLVYSAASRQVGFHPQAAEEVTQTVFTHLARKAGELLEHTSLAGWLYSSTRLAASQYCRTEARRFARETAAHAMDQLIATKDPEPDWDSIRSVLDDAMSELSGEDRDAVLLRFLENRSLAEVGKRLALTENTARMRVERALDKLYAALAKRGITSTSAALVLALATHAVTPSPVGMAERIGSAITPKVAGATATGGVAIYGALTVFVLILTSAGLMWTSRNAFGPAAGAKANHAEEVTSPQKLIGIESNSTNVPTERVDPELEAAGTSPNIETGEFGPNDVVFELAFVSTESGKPVPNVPVEYRAWSEFGVTNRHFTAGKGGRVKLPVPTSNTTHLARMALT